MRFDLRALCRWQRAAPLTSAVAPPLLHGTTWSAWSPVVARQRSHRGCLCSHCCLARARRIFFCSQVNRRWGSRHLRCLPIARAMTASGTKMRRIAARTMSESRLDATGGSWDRGERSGRAPVKSRSARRALGDVVTDALRQGGACSEPQGCFDLTSSRSRTNRAMRTTLGCYAMTTTPPTPHGLSRAGDGRRSVSEARSEMPRPTRRSPC